VCYTNQWPATPFSFSHAGAANNLDAAYVNQDVSNGQRLNWDYRGHNRNPLFSSGIFDLFIMCVGTRNYIFLNIRWRADAPQTDVTPAILSRHFVAQRYRETKLQCATWTVACCNFVARYKVARQNRAIKSQVWHRYKVRHTTLRMAPSVLTTVSYMGR